MGGPDAACGWKLLERMGAADSVRDAACRAGATPSANLSESTEADGLLLLLACASEKGKGPPGAAAESSLVAC